jgi:hypothetical protein
MEHANPFLEFPWYYEPSEIHFFPIFLHHGRKTLLIELLPKFNSFITLKKTWMHGGHLLSENCHHSGLGFCCSRDLGKETHSSWTHDIFPFQFQSPNFHPKLDFFTACVITSNDTSLETTGKLWVPWKSEIWSKTTELCSSVLLRSPSELYSPQRVQQMQLDCMYLSSSVIKFQPLVSCS